MEKSDVVVQLLTSGFRRRHYYFVFSENRWCIKALQLCQFLPSVLSQHCWRFTVIWIMSNYAMLSFQFGIAKSQGHATLGSLVRETQEAKRNSWRFSLNFSLYLKTIKHFSAVDYCLVRDKRKDMFRCPARLKKIFLHWLEKSSKQIYYIFLITVFQLIHCRTTSSRSTQSDQ